jgi:hypothetical protein
MEIDSPESKAYLFELYTMTGGDTDIQVSMYDVGTTLGLEQSEAGTMAENLFIQGLAELKTLSGGIGITRQGLKVLDIKPAPKPGDEFLDLGKGPVLEDKNIEAVNKILQDIKDSIASSTSAYPQIETLVIDIKTIEIQMLSPRIKTQIIREVLRSILSTLKDQGPEDLVDKLDALITS